MAVPLEIQERRTAEYDAARSRYEIDQLIAKHRREDQTLEAEQDWRTQEVRQRLSEISLPRSASLRA